MALAQVAVARPQIGIAAGVLEALDRLRVAVTLFDAQERLIYSNAHYNYIFRSFPPFESLIGAPYESLIRLEIAGGEIDRFHLENIEAFVTARRRQLLENDFRPLDIHLADGRVIELKARGTASGTQIVLWSDVTQARKLFSRLEDTIALSVDAFAYWDENDRLMLCNAAFAEMHGLVSLEEATGLSFLELMKRAISQGKFTINGSVTAWVERRIDAHEAAAGALTLSTTAGEAYLVRERATRGGGSVTVFTNVSERNRAEAALAEQSLALQRTKRALQKSKSEAKRRASFLADLTRRLDAAESEVDTAKATLLRTMSHELKTPLNAIIGFADLMRATPGRFSTEQIGEYATLIHMAGGNLLRLINQILDLTKIAAGRYPLQRAPISIAHALASAYDLNAARAQSKQLSVEGVQCAGDLFADADENALTVMLTHLLENAMTYTQPGGAVRIGVGREDGYIRVTIADNGPGVAECDLERILEPFEQGGRGTADHSFGTGLGLPIVKALADLHGGSLSITSVLGEGFTAVLEIPSA